MEDAHAFASRARNDRRDDAVTGGFARALLRAAIDAVIVLDNSARLLYASPSAADLTGYRVEDRLGESVLDLVHPDDLDIASQSLANTTAVPGPAVPLRFRIRRPDGAVRLVEAVATNLLDDADVRGIVVNLHDLTDREDALSTLQVAENRFRRMLENISDTVTLVDGSGEVIDTTGNVKAILGYPSEFWSMRNAFDLAHPEDVDQVRRLLVELLESPGREVSGELRVRHAEGRYETIEATAVNLLDDEDVRAIVITSRNVSARKRVEAQLAAARDEAVRALEVRTEFIASVSHELRTPIHGILGLSELLATADVDDETRSLARSIGRATESLRMVLDDLLDFTKIEAGRLELQAEAVSLKDVLDDLRTLFGPQATAKGVDLHIELDPSLPSAIEADPLRLRQVLTNLVGNAVKFTAEGTVTVGVSSGVAPEQVRPGNDEAAGAVMFTVADTGIGMAPQVVAQVFEPFSQAHATTAREYGGTGLGLTIARRLVELMGGELHVETEPERGSTFTFSVPAPALETAVASEEPPPVPAAASRRVMVVEDNPVNQLLVARQLERLGYDPVVVDGGAAALEHLELDLPDVVLMDWQMPHMDGLETTRRIREREATRGMGRVPIVAMTASAMPGDRARCLEAGMDDFVSKPVSLAALGHVLAAWTPPTDPASSAMVSGGSRHDEDGVDPSVLDRLVDELGGAAVVEVVVATYLRELPVRLAGLGDAVQVADRAATVAIAHTLKSTSAAVGATRLSSACGRLETWGRDLDVGVDDPAPLLVEVRTQALAAEWALTRELARLRSR
ncbi:MAG: PAS domain S-box protein [Acidimicrobiales bacterium]